MISLFFSCEKDLELASNDIEDLDESVNTRAEGTSEYGIVSIERPESSLPTCQAGNYSVVNGMIKFQDFDSFIQTIDF